MALPGVVAHPRPLCASLMFNLFLLSRTKQLTIIFSGTLGGGTLCLLSIGPMVPVTSVGEPTAAPLGHGSRKAVPGKLPETDGSFDEWLMNA